MRGGAEVAVLSVTRVRVLQVLEELDVGLPLSITADLIDDEGYWQRACASRFLNCDITQHNDSWKQLFFERNLQGTLPALFAPHSAAQTLRRQG